MASKTPAIAVVCAQCARPFTLTPPAHARRLARYGEHLLCARCLADSWLHSTWQGATARDALLREGEPATP